MRLPASHAPDLNTWRGTAGAREPVCKPSAQQEGCASGGPAAWGRAAEQWATRNIRLMYCHGAHLMWFRVACQVPPCSSPSRWIGKLSTSVCCALQMQRADALDAQLQQEWGEILAAQGRSTEAATHLSAAAALFTQQMAEAPHVLVVRL